MSGYVTMLFLVQIPLLLVSYRRCDSHWQFLTKFAWIYHWDRMKNLVGFGDIDKKFQGHNRGACFPLVYSVT